MNESWLLELIAEELHALVGVLLVQVDQGRYVEVGERALGVEEDDDEGLLVLEVVERSRPAVDVLEREVRDLRPDCRG